MTVEQIIEKVHAILVSDFEIAPESITPEARLREDLELDSLDGVDLVVALENAFGIRVDNKVVVEMKTVGDIHAYVERIFAERSA
jgi:acyl carrier protein